MKFSPGSTYRHGLCVALLAISFNANAMEQAQQAQQKPAKRVPTTEEVVTCTDLGGTVITEEHHCYTATTTTTVTRKIKKTTLWATGEEVKDLPQCKKVKPYKPEENWQTDNCSQKDSKTRSKMDTKQLVSSEPTEITTRAICQHEDDVYVIETTTKASRVCKEWDLLREEEIKPDNPHQKVVKK
jgi:hypothetical protein